ncbi:MAG: PD40 domain-containing protein [Chitinophagaceae bacterium]|nr:PD40 domain-containing protein [Chitinophagaceae bacterium]
MRLLPRLITCIPLFLLVIHASGQEVVEEVIEDIVVEEEAPPSSKPQKFDSPMTKLVNRPGVADAYPFLSADGLRLYFTSNREGGHGRFFISTRKNVSEPFGEPAVLSKHLTDGYYAGTLTADELTLCMVHSGDMYISKRKTIYSEFGEPIAIKGIPEQYHYGPAISPDGNTIIVTATLNGSDVFKIYRKQSGYTFTEAGLLPVPEAKDIGPGQFSKDGLAYYFSIEDEEVAKEASIWRYSRTSLNSRFVDLEKLPVTINTLQRNFQPTVNTDASVIVYVTSQNDSWDEDDIVLVNDPAKALTAPEQFISIMKNDARNLTVKEKVTTTQVRTFPNPFLTDVIIEMNSEPGDGTIFLLFDLTGKQLKQQRVTSTKTSIQLSGLPAATYIYQVIDGKKRVIASGKLVKG